MNSDPFYVAIIVVQKTYSRCAWSASAVTRGVRSTSRGRTSESLKLPQWFVFLVLFVIVLSSIVVPYSDGTAS